MLGQIPYIIEYTLKRKMFVQQHTESFLPTYDYSFLFYYSYMLHTSEQVRHLYERNYKNFWFLAQRQKIHFLFKTSRPALEPTWPPTQWAPVIFRWGQSGRDVKLGLKMGGTIHLLPVSLCRVYSNSLSFIFQYSIL